MSKCKNYQELPDEWKAQIAIIIFVAGFYAGWLSKPKQEIELPPGSVTKEPDTTPSRGMIMKNLEQREGFKNRHTDGLPSYPCMIGIVRTYKAMDEPPIEICFWKPYDPQKYPPNDQPPGYLGTACEKEDGIGIGYHAWEQNNSEFIWYKIL